MLKINMELLKRIMPQFRKSIATEDQDWRRDREERAKFLAKYFSKEQIPKLDEGALRELIYMLWAYSGWTNKDYLLQDMLKSSLDTIKQAFLYLLYSNDSIEKRFDYMQRNLKRMGPACISEILLYHDHNKYPIWNTRSKTALLALGIDNHLLKRPHINGSQYEEFCELVKDAHSQVVSKYPEVEDLFAFDYLLYFISQQKDLTPFSEEVESISEIKDEATHKAVIEQLLKLGDGLGFDVDDEVPVRPKCQVDVVWSTRIANLGMVSYAFEVQKRGSPDKAIVHLLTVCRDPSFRRVFLVSTEDGLEDLKTRISGLGDDDFKRRLSYFNVDDLRVAINHLDALREIMKRGGLLEDKSLFDRDKCN